MFFPTCTGLMAGVNMQGDLKNPHNNISTGSLASLAFRYLCFFTFKCLASEGFGESKQLNIVAILLRLKVAQYLLLIFVRPLLYSNQVAMYTRLVNLIAS